MYPFYRWGMCQPELSELPWEMTMAHAILLEVQHLGSLLGSVRFTDRLWAGALPFPYVACDCEKEAVSGWALAYDWKHLPAFHLSALQVSRRQDQGIALERKTSLSCSYPPKNPHCLLPNRQPFVHFLMDKTWLSFHEV